MLLVKLKIFQFWKLVLHMVYTWQFLVTSGNNRFNLCQVINYPLINFSH
jgi:hypothetical protein